MLNGNAIGYNPSPQITNLLLRQNQQRQTRVPNTLNIPSTLNAQLSVNAMTNDTLMSAEQLVQMMPQPAQNSSKVLLGKKKKKKRANDVSGSRDSINDIIEGIAVARGINQNDQVPDYEESKKVIDFYAGQSLEEQKVPRVKLNKKLIDPSPARERPSISLMSDSSNN